MFIPDMAAGCLFLVIVLLYTFQYIKAQVQKPVISTSHNEEDFIITCLIPGIAGNDTCCNLYIGEKNKPFLKTRIWKKKTQKTKQWYCTFSVTEDDLIRHLQSVRSKAVSCDYRVNSGTNSLSPRSDGYSFTDLVEVHISDPTTITAGLTSPLTPSTAVNPTSGWTVLSTLTTDTAKISTEACSTVASTLTLDITVRPTTSLTSPLTSSTAVTTTSGSTVRSTLTTDTTLSPTEGKGSTESILSGQVWQAAVAVVSGVGVFLVGLTAFCLCRSTKKNNSQRPTARQDDDNQYDLVLGAMSSAAMMDSGEAGIYSLITSVPATFLPSGPVQVSAHEDVDSGNTGIYRLITAPRTSIPSGPIEENGQSFENYTTDTYHIYCSIPDKLANSAQPDGLYSLLQAH
ncbi:mucin-5AC isoform X4 [Oncorhynchus kisutch]|uniref:mucin-5AC isoform X4 n=1 Tax=Oncorhynchus kisutch TaxID=8019 RepID=UPI0012DE0526|nr:mucin-5AC isoform X4 [Oncorhynchus kisutch]